MRFSICFGVALLFCLGPAVPTYAQERALVLQLYGQGVHAYFAQDYAQAHELLTQAIEGGTRDPRTYYFRAMTYLNLGRPDEAEADMARGAELEATDVGLRAQVSRALERVQGKGRQRIEQHRTAARLTQMQRQDAIQRQRYETRRQNEEEVLRRQVDVPLDEFANPPAASPSAPAPSRTEANPRLPENNAQPAAPRNQPAPAPSSPAPVPSSPDPARLEEYWGLENDEAEGEIQPPSQPAAPALPTEPAPERPSNPDPARLEEYWGLEDDAGDNERRPGAEPDAPALPTAPALEGPGNPGLAPASRPGAGPAQPSSSPMGTFMRILGRALWGSGDRAIPEAAPTPTPPAGRVPPPPAAPGTDSRDAESFDALEEDGGFGEDEDNEPGPGLEAAPADERAPADPFGGDAGEDDPFGGEETPAPGTEEPTDEAPAGEEPADPFDTGENAPSDEAEELPPRPEPDNGTPPKEEDPFGGDAEDDGSAPRDENAPGDSEADDPFGTGEEAPASDAEELPPQEPAAEERDPFGDAGEEPAPDRSGENPGEAGSNDDPFGEAEGADDQGPADDEQPNEADSDDPFGP